MRRPWLISLCLLLALVLLGVQGAEEIHNINDDQNPHQLKDPIAQETLTQEPSKGENIKPVITNTLPESQPSSEDRELTYQKANSLYEEGIQKRKYRFWLEYGPDYEWTERKQPVDVEGAIKLLEEAGELGVEDGFHAIGEMYEYGETGHIDFIKAREYYEKAAKTGNPSSQAALGFLYGTGKNVTSNEPLAQLYTLFAARSGDSLAQMTMGYKYLYGHGTPKDCHKAAEWYYLAAHQAITDAEDGLGSVNEQIRLSVEAESTHPIQHDEDVVQYFQYSASAGDSQSFVNLGDLHLNGGYGAERSYARAFDYYKQAAELQNPAGLSGMASMYAHGWGVEQNNLTAMKYYKQAAELGSPQAQTQLGIYYYRGWNVAKNYKEALRLFNLAYEQEYPGAMAQLDMYSNGEGVPKDSKKAYNYYLEGYKKGHLSSIFHLAEMYLHGHGTQFADCHTAVVLYKIVAERGLWAELLIDAHDFYEEALLVYEHLAEMGYEVAQSNAAWMYEKHLGVTIRESGWPTIEYAENQAFRYYTRSAEQHNPTSHVILGDYYYYGRGIEVDHEKAANYYKAAKSQPHIHSSQAGAVAQALFNLGYMHEHGIGVEKDLFLAKRYYDDALVKNGDAYIAVGLALAKLGLHYIHDVITGELDLIPSSSSSTPPSSASATPTATSTPSSSTSSRFPSPALLSKLRSLQWDTILGMLIVARQRRMLQQQQQQPQQQPQQPPQPQQ